MATKASDSRLKRSLRSARQVLFGRTFWLGILAILVFWLVVYAVFDWWIMPSYTRHGVQVEVPDLTTLRLSEAMEIVHDEGFELGQVLRYFEPEEPAMVVLKQDPAPGASVKPGRRIYLTINSGSAQKVEVPDLQFVSMREARSRLAANRLSLGMVYDDSLPAPFENTITRQRPEAGDSTAVGSVVDIWISTGLGTTMVDVPEITDMSAADAERLLLLSRLRLVVLEDAEIPASRLDTIAHQQPAAGTKVRSGSEIHAFANMAEMPYDPAEQDSIEAAQSDVDGR